MTKSPGTNSQNVKTSYNVHMKYLKILLFICSILWAAAVIYLIYSIGMAILTLSIGPLITGLIVFVFATIAEITLAILTD